MPVFVRQLDGSPLAGDNCGPASVAMALRWATEHHIQPSPTLVRMMMGDPTGGTFMKDHRKAWDEARQNNADVWTVGPMRYHAAGDFVDLLSRLWEGAGATIAIDYSKVPQNLKGDPLFNGLHSVFIAGIRERAEVTEIKVFDPLNDGRRPGIPGPGAIWYPKLVLRKAAGAVVGEAGKAMYNVVRKGEPVAQPEPDLCYETVHRLTARIDELEDALGTIRGMLVAHQDGVAAALADIDAVLDIPDDTGQEPRG